MNKVSVTLSANAGVSVELGGYRVWVDALHESSEPGFSTLSPQLQRTVFENEHFARPDAIVYTHCHGDHYSRRLTAGARERFPDAAILLPQRDFDSQIAMESRELFWQKGELTLQFFRVPHEGERYADVPHYAILISIPGCNVLLSGDCATADPAMAQAVAGTPVDLAVMDFPWLALKKGRDMLENTLKPAHVLLYHLPFAEDDSFGYRNAAARARKNASVDARLLLEPLQTEVYEF